MPEQTQQQQSGIQNVWYISHSFPSIDVFDYDVVIPDFNIIATVNLGESLHVLFNADVVLQCDLPAEYLRVYVSLNGNKVGTPRATVGAWHDIIIYGHITLHYSNLTISPGLYSINMIATSVDPLQANTLSQLSLLVFTLK